MYAVVARASLDHERLDEIVATITTLIVPVMRARPGHVATYVCRSADGMRGVALSVFETLDQADATASAMVVPPESPVRVESLEVLDLVANA
jgi:hypothetical protein